MTEVLLWVAASVVGGFVSSYFAPRLLKRWEHRAEERRHLRRVLAGLAAIKIYVAASLGMVDHEDLQKRLSQHCAERFGEIAAAAAAA